MDNALAKNFTFSSLLFFAIPKGENYWDGSIKNLSKGNTEIVAEMIQRAVGGDLFEIDTVKPYSLDYNICKEEAKQELRTNAGPALKKYIDGLDEYDTIFVGYPNWCQTMPMAMFTFLERYDLRGKRILPFCTHEGSGMGNSERDLKRICVGANIDVEIPTERTKQHAQYHLHFCDWRTSFYLRQHGR